MISLNFKVISPYSKVISPYSKVISLNSKVISPRYSTVISLNSEVISLNSILGREKSFSFRREIKLYHLAFNVISLNSFHSDITLKTR